MLDTRNPPSTRLTETGTSTDLPVSKCTAASETSASSREALRLCPFTWSMPPRRNAPSRSTADGCRPAGSAAAATRAHDLEGGDVEPDVVDLGPQRLELHGPVEDLSPLLQEADVPVVAGLVEGRLAHLLHQLGGGEHLHDPVGHRLDATAGHQEAVHPVGDLLAGTVLDVVADHRAAMAEALQRRQRVALEEAGHQERAGAPERVARPRVVPVQGHRVCDTVLLRELGEQRHLAPRPVDVEPGGRDLVGGPGEGPDRMTEALLLLEAGDHRHPVGVAGRQVRVTLGHVDRVGHDEQVRRTTPPLGDVVLLAGGEGDEGVDSADLADQALVDVADRGAPQPRRGDVDVVQDVDQVDVAGPHRNQVLCAEPRVDEQEAALVAGEVPHEALEPLPERPELARDGAVRRHALDRTRPAVRLLEHELRDPEEGRPVRPLVVVDRALEGVRTVDDPER